jgi:Protein of unknown function (DUF642)
MHSSTTSGQRLGLRRHPAGAAQRTAATKLSILALAGSLAAGVFLATAARANLLVDGSFESPVVQPGGFTVFPTNTSFGPGWTVVGASGNVAIVSGTLTQSGYSFPAQDGVQWMDLTGTSNSATGVQQTIVTTPGAFYSLSFWVGNVSDPTGIFGTTSTVNVLVNGAPLLTATNTGGAKTLAWQQFHATFIATSSSTNIAFMNGDPSNDTSNGIDNVEVSLASAASCPFEGSAGDFLTKGIVVQGYSGTNVGLVELGYGASAAGLYSITATIRRGTFDGPLVGAPQTVWVNLPNSFTDTPVIFDFGGAPVTPGDTLTLTQGSTGPGELAFDRGGSAQGTTGACNGVYETENTVPPLSTERRPTAGILITQNDLSGACIPSDTVMCIDNLIGDRRFKATVSFATSQGGGVSGDGQEIVEGTLGVTHGGLFWFFSQDNPEMLIKVIDGCSLNNKFWVFFSAGTNVGFTLTMTDTLTGQFHVYHNLDLMPATPIQDTSALPCS